MIEPSPLPDSLPEHFTTTRALSEGVSPARLRRSDLEAPFHGVRRRRCGSEDAGDRERIRRLALSLATRMTDDEFLSHVTAAVLWELPLPRALLRATDLDVAVLTPRRNPSGRGVRGHEVAPALVRVVVHPETGVRVSSPASTWAMLGAQIRNLPDLVAAGDAIVRIPQHPNDPPALGTLSQLTAAVHAGRRVGVGALREALPRVRVGASSAPETRTRLTLVDHGLPEPELGVEVVDADGVFIGRLDMAYRRQRVAVEYEGEQHLIDPRQWTRDILRYERLAAAGWHVIRVTKTELQNDPRGLAARVRRALAARAD